jgi:hypothetical protein
MRYLISFFLVCVSMQLNAQQKTYTEPVLTATFLSPGITYEHPVANKFTIKGKAAFTVGWSFSASSSLGQSYSLSPTPLIAGQLRYYYNFGLRKTKEKNIAHNSANYISFLLRYAYSGVTYYYGDQGNFSVKQASHMPDFGIVWGIQRNYKNRFSIDCSVGPSLYAPLANNDFNLIADISLGIWLGRKHDR